MRTPTRWLTTVVAILALLLTPWWQIDSTGEPAEPAHAPSKASAVATACQAARSAALNDAQQTAAIVVAGEQAQAVALSIAGLRARRGETARAAPSSRGAPAPAPAPAAALPASARVPILMYHHIADAPPEADAVRRDLSVSPANFGKQMDWLVANKYETISLADLADHLTTGRALPARPVILTFDDGYDDNYTYAYRILKQHGQTGTFFIITDAAGNREYMTWDQIAEMSRNGMAIEPHGRTHADLAVSSPADTVWQVQGSRAALQDKTGQPVRFYCYPSGKYTAQTIATLRAQGFLGAVTITYGATHTAAGLFELTRVRMRGGDTLGDFTSKVTATP